MPYLIVGRLTYLLFFAWWRSPYRWRIVAGYLMFGLFLTLIGFK